MSLVKNVTAIDARNMAEIEVSNIFGLKATPPPSCIFAKAYKFSQYL